MAYGYTHDEHISKVCCLQNRQHTDALQKAVYLTLDATDAAKDIEKTSMALDFLHTNYNLAREITYEQIITPNVEHQWYTHLGWEYDYSKELPEGWTQEMANKQQKRFLLRKSILLNTIEFIFPTLTNEKINSLAALLYYIHISGDLRYNNTPYNMITITELVSGYEKHLYILFGEEANTIINTIKNLLMNVSFEEDAEPLDKTFEVLFKHIPILIANFTSSST